MKIPFRYQSTEYDCVPTTFINALQFLFKRDEIPPIAIQKIMQYSLDTVSERGEFGSGKGGGTTGYAVQMIMYFLESYKKGVFSLKCEYIGGAQVHLRQGNKIMTCINRGGIALMCVCTDKTAVNTHYILAMGLDSADRASFLFFDPYYRIRKFSGENAEHVELLSYGKRQEPNLRVSRERLDSSDLLPYSMGPVDMRECCLLERSN
jgi:hypothetical protein